MEKAVSPSPPKPTSFLRGQQLQTSLPDTKTIVWWRSITYKLFFLFLVVSVIPTLLISLLMAEAYNEAVVHLLPAGEEINIKSAFSVELLLVAFFIFLISVLAALVLSRNISNPMQMLIDAMKKVIQNDMNVAVEVSRRDELGSLAAFFNLMVNKIRETRERDATISRLKSEFVSVAAHQLRTPLSAIKWAMRLLLDGDFGQVSQEQRQLIERSFETNERLIHLVNDLLNVARIEEGKFGYNFQSVPIINLMQSIVNDFGEQAKQKKITLSFRPLIQEMTLLVDPDRLGLAMSNLLDNALHYTPAHGQINVNLNKNNDELLVAVEDTGIGIPEQEKERMFGRFARASNAVKMHTDGTGLGLFIVKNIIARHEGRVWFESREGKGTTFFFTLPIRQKAARGAERTFEEFISKL